MRVLLASHSAGVTAGAERSLLEIAKYLDSRGADVLVALPGEGPFRDALSARELDSAVLPYGWALATDTHDGLATSLDGLGALVEQVRSYAPDVVMTNTIVIPWFAYAARALAIPHAWFIREDLSSDPGFVLHPDARTTLDIVAAWSDAVFVPSHYMRDTYNALLGRSDVQVVYPTFERRLLEREPTQRQRAARWRVIVCASLLRHKNQLELLKAAARLAGTRDDFEVTLMGAAVDPAYVAELEQFIADSGLGSRVSIVPPLHDPYPTLEQHDIGVVPSTNEPSSRMMVEAMLLGLAVVASDAGGNVEKAGGAARAALLYPLGDDESLAQRLDSLMSDPDALREQAERGRRYARETYADRDQLAVLFDGLNELARTAQRKREDWITVDLVARAARGRAAALERDVLAAQVADLDAALMRQAGALSESQAETDALGGRIRSYEGSTSWRLTAPARAVGRLFRSALSRVR